MAVRRFAGGGGMAVLVGALAATGLLLPVSEALILENNRIKQYKPPYNLRLKDDKSYLSAKVTGGYADLAGDGGTAVPVLFWLPTARREAGARRALATSPVPAATASAERGSPAEAIWLPVGADDGPRRCLGALEGAMRDDLLSGSVEGR